MLFTRKIGNAEVSNVIEYSGPTHDPGFLFPDMPREIIEETCTGSRRTTSADGSISLS